MMKNGYLTQDEEGHKLIYDSMYYLRDVQDANGENLSKCHYDESGKLAPQVVPGKKEACFYYQGDNFVAVIIGDFQISYLSGGHVY